MTDIWKGHHLADTEAEACAIAVKAGLNVECGSSFKALRQALDQGLLTTHDIDRALRPLVMTRLKLGILGHDPDCPYNDTPADVVGCDKHISLARQAARESMVLLKNNGVLPLPKDLNTLYVTGPGAGTSAPLRQLVDFRRVTLAPGEQRDVTFHVPADRLATVTDDGSSRLLPGLHTLTVASAAPSPRSEVLGVQALTATIAMP